MNRMIERMLMKLKTWPTPIEQEQLENMGFFHRDGWRIFCSRDEVENIAEWLKSKHLSYSVDRCDRVGKYEDHPRLSDQLLRSDGGSPTACALCGKGGVACRQWIEGDDADRIDRALGRRFYLCGLCVQAHISAHHRLYSHADDVL